MPRISVVAGLAILGIAVLCEGAAGARVNVVARGVVPVTRTGEAFAAGLLLVYVVDQDGEPLGGVDVTLAFADGTKGAARTVKDGTALMKLTHFGTLTLRAAGSGYTTAEAREVSVKANGLTSVALPLASLGE